MSLQWSDFPSGQPGIYGTGGSNMLDGTPWVSLAGSPGAVADPDSANFPDGIVLEHGHSTDGIGNAVRLSLPFPTDEVGCEFRFWATPIPPEARTFFGFNTGSNSPRYSLVLSPNGSVQVYYGTDVVGLGRLVADSVVPIIFAGSYNHIGFKVNLTTNSYEVRKNGVPVPALTGVDESGPSGGTIGLVCFPDGNAGSASWNNYKSKDIIVWDTLGTEINDFQGTVAVRDLYPDQDITLGDWTLSSGTEGFALVNETTPDDAGYVNSGLTPTAAIEFGFTDLPVDITSVRAVSMIMRAFNSESGDGEIQATLSPDGGVSNDAGAEHFLTITPTYYWDHSTLSPATGVAWTPNEVNNLTVSYNRTL